MADSLAARFESRLAWVRRLDRASSRLDNLAALRRFPRFPDALAGYRRGAQIRNGQFVRSIAQMENK